MFWPIFPYFAGGGGREGLKSLLLFVSEKCYLCDMKLAEKVLRRLYKDRDVFTADEVARVEAVIDAYNEEKSLRGKKYALPTRFVAVGEEVVVSGKRFVCRVAARVSVPSDACSGCSLSKLYLGCGDLQCSPFDRKDGKFVWFGEVKKS